jgi:hypothetical protein
MYGDWFHWYGNWSGEQMFDNVHKVYEAYPDKKNYYLLKVASKNLMQINTSFGLTYKRDMEKQ